MSSGTYKVTTKDNVNLVELKVIVGYDEENGPHYKEVSLNRINTDLPPTSPYIKWEKNAGVHFVRLTEEAIDVIVTQLKDTILGENHNHIIHRLLSPLKEWKPAVR